MSDEDEDSSHQLERLLPDSGTSPPSTDDTTVASNVESYLQSQNGDIIDYDGTNGEQQPQPENQSDPNQIHPTFDCYKWLLNGRERRLCEAVSSTDSSVSLSSSSEASVPSLPVPKPPDGGWGWVVVLGSFFVLVICDGLSYCFGILYSELLTQFGDTRSKTSLVGSIFFGVSMILGPFASAMTTKYGCRRMTIVGGLLSSVGLLLSSFATSIDMLCFTFSFIVGVGFSFCFITSVVIVHFYFDKHRSFATGLAVCGTGVGTFSFAPLMEYLISEYQCQGLFLILSAISLNLVVCGMLFRPLKFTEEERRQYFSAEFDKLPPGRESLELGRLRNFSECTEFSTDLEGLDEESRTMSMLSLPTFASGNAKATAADTNESSVILMEALKNSRNRQLTYHRYMKNAYFRSNSPEKTKEANLFNKDTVTISVGSNATEESLPFSHCESDKIKDSLSQSLINKNQTKKSATLLPPVKHPADICRARQPNNVKKNGDLSLVSSYADLSSQSREMRSRSVSKVLSGVSMGKHNSMGIQVLLYRTDIFYRRHLNQAPYNPCLMGTSCPELIETPVPQQIKIEGRWRAFKAYCSRAFAILIGTVDLHLFTNLFFTVFVISNFIFYFWSDIPYMYAIDHSVAQNIDPDKASFLISIIGICNTFGQIIFGLIGDMKINLIMVYAIVLATSGIFVAIVPLMEVYWAMALSYSLFGFFVSVTFPFSTVLLVNFLGLDQLTNAYGLLMLMQGIANVLGPPFAGWISDTTSSYDASFYLSGTFYAMSGLIMFVVLIPGCKAEKLAVPQVEVVVENC